MKTLTIQPLNCLIIKMLHFISLFVPVYAESTGEPENIFTYFRNEIEKRADNGEEKNDNPNNCSYTVI